MSSVKTRRLFLGVDLPPAAKKECGRIGRRLKETGADVKWVEEANFHVTLKFLGDVEEGRTQEVTAACEAVGRSHAAFSFSLCGLGAFPSQTAPRVLWIGVQEPAQAFPRLAQGLEEALGPLGFKKEDRAFHPHVTIGRVRSPLNRVHLIEALRREAAAVRVADLPAKNVTLFESTLTPKGALYTCLASLPFMA